MSTQEECVAPCPRKKNQGAAAVEKVANDSELKNKRKQARGKITRAMKRINEAMAKREKSVRRFEKETEQLRKDFEIAREIHGQMYDFGEVDDTI